MADGKVTGWFTVDGKHIPIMEGESKQDAFDRVIGKKTDYKRKGLTKTDSKQFVGTLDKARDTRPSADKWRVDNTHTPSELEERGCRCYVSAGGSTVAVDKNGDIISVCKAKGDKTTSGAELLRQAVRLGGTKLDSFYGNHMFYCANGFQPICYTPFNEQYAPDGWKTSGSGHEPVVFYRYVGVGRVRNTDISKLPEFTGDDGYDRAQEYRDRH